MKLFSTLTFFILLVGTQGQQIIERVMCKGSQGAEDIVTCGFNQIIDVHSVTIAAVEEWRPCVTDRLGPLIDSLSPNCKRRSGKTSGNNDGMEIYKRCHGEDSCSVFSHTVPDWFLNDGCANAGFPNVLYYSYACLPINANTNALLPSPAVLPSSKVDIFSPYYGCDMPAGDYSLRCYVRPVSMTNNVKSLKVTVKLLEFKQTNDHCEDYFWFRGDTSGNINGFNSYCSVHTHSKEIWDEELPVNAYFYNYWELIFQKHRNSGVDSPEGGKFWIQVSGTEGGYPINLQVTCENVENFPPNTGGCIPLKDRVPPVPTTRTTTPAPTTTTPAATPPGPTIDSAAVPAPTSPPSTMMAQSEIKQGVVKDSDSSSDDTAYFIVLGVLLVLVILFAVLAVVLMRKIRRKKKKMALIGKNDGEHVTKPKVNGGLNSLQRIPAYIKRKRLAAKKSKRRDQELGLEEIQQQTSNIEETPPTLSGKQTTKQKQTKSGTSSLRADKVAIVHPFEAVEMGDAAASPYTQVDKNKAEASNYQKLNKNETTQKVKNVSKSNTGFLSRLRNMRRKVPESDYDNVPVRSTEINQACFNEELNSSVENLTETKRTKLNNTVKEDPIVQSQPSLYENVAEFKREDEDDIQERRGSVALPDNYPGRGRRQSIV